MKVFAVICALVAIALAMTLGISLHTDATQDDEQNQALQTAELQLQHARQEQQAARDRLNVRQAELDITRKLLAEAKTQESGLRLQLAEAELKIRQLGEQLETQKQSYATLEKLNREVKSELVRLHTTNDPSGLTQERLLQYEREIADLQRQLNQLRQAQ